MIQRKQALRSQIQSQVTTLFLSATSVQAVSLLIWKNISAFEEADPDNLNLCGSSMPAKLPNFLGHSSFLPNLCVIHTVFMSVRFYWHLFALKLKSNETYTIGVSHCKTESLSLKHFCIYIYVHTTFTFTILIYLIYHISVLRKKCWTAWRGQCHLIHDCLKK